VLWSSPAYIGTSITIATIQPMCVAILFFADVVFDITGLDFMVCSTVLIALLQQQLTHAK
jgi:hypothetical protein